MSITFVALEQQLAALESSIEETSGADVIRAIRRLIDSTRPVKRKRAAAPVLVDDEDDDQVIAVSPPKRVKGPDEPEPEEAEGEEEVVPVDAAAAAAAAAAKEGPYLMTAAQEPVVARSVECCRALGRFVNESDGGAGKTCISVEAAHRLVLPILCIGLSGTMAAKWRNHAHRQGVVLLEYLSWDGLRGARAKGTDKAACSKYPNVSFPVKLAHGWLTRRDAWSGKFTSQSTRNKRTRKTIKKRVKVYDSVFAPTAQLLDAIEKGVLVVADEVQKAKNDSKQNMALATIVGAIYADVDVDGAANSLLSPGKNGSCVMALSATTLDKPEHALRICRTLGLLPPVMGEAFTYDRATMLYEPNSGDVSRFMDMCRELDDAAYAEAERETLQNTSGYIHVDNRTGRVVAGYTAASKLPHHIRREAVSGKERPQWFLFMLYVAIVRKQLSGAVSQRYDADPDVRLDLKNVIYRIDEDKQDEFNRLTEELEEARAAGSPPDVLDSIRRRQEALKNDLFIHAPRKILEANPQAKVFIILNYIDGIQSVAKGLEEFGVGLIYGEISTASRQKTLDAFQATSSKLRVIVGQVTACTAGIDLHDTTGLWPRYTFISPSPMATDIQQGFKRTKREGVKGLITITIVYGGSGELVKREDNDRKIADEAETMQKLMKKSATLKAVAEQQVKDGVPFPSDLPIYRENKQGELVLEQLQEEDDGEGGFVVRRRNGDGDDDNNTISGDEDDDEDADDDEDGVAAAIAASLLVPAFSVGDKLKMFQERVDPKAPWMASIVCALEPNGNFTVATARNASRPGSKIVRVSAPRGLLDMPTRNELADHWRLWQFDAHAPSVPNIETANVFLTNNTNQSTALPTSTSTPTPAQVPAPSTQRSLSSALAASSAAQVRHRQMLASEMFQRTNQVGVKLTNGLSWLSNDWCAGVGASSQASVEATRNLFGVQPPPATWGFNLHQQYYPSVTHYVHSQLCMDQAKAEQVRCAETPSEARRLWPLPLGNGGHNAPQVRRLMVEGMRAKFEQSAYAQRILMSTGVTPLVAVDSVADNVSLLEMVRGRLEGAGTPTQR